MRDHKPTCWKFIGSVERRANNEKELFALSEKQNGLGLLNNLLLAIGQESRIRQEPNEIILEVLTCGH